jgi:hypothetical protein
VIKLGIEGFLREKGVSHAIIGAVALAVHGAPRYSSDVDVLVLDSAVLSAHFWASHGSQPLSIARGDPDDPLAGLVVFPGPTHGLSIDVVVGKGYAARMALETATMSQDLDCPVVSPLGLALLKLEAGGIGDLQDLVALDAAQQQLTGWELVSAVEPHLSKLSKHAKAAWGKLSLLLSMQAGASVPPGSKLPRRES